MARPKGSVENPDSYMSAEQRFLFAKVQRAQAAYNEVRENAEAVIRQRVAEQMQGARTSRDAAVLEAYEPTTGKATPSRGLRIATIKRAMGVSDHSTVKAILDLYDPTLHVTTEPVEFTLHEGTWNPAERRGEFTLHYATLKGVEITEDVVMKVNHEDGWFAYIDGAVNPDSPFETALLAWRDNDRIVWHQELGARVGAAFEVAAR